MKYEERLTQWVGDEASLILDNPTTAEEARRQVMVQFKKACIKLAELEDKLESGELIERTSEECSAVRKQVVREFVEEFKCRYFFMMATCIEDPIYQCTGDELDRLVKEVCEE